MTYKERDFARKVGKRMRMFRKKAGLTQQKVYVRTNITPNSISNYESGARCIDLSRLYKLAKCYGCKVSDLVEVGR